MNEILKNRFILKLLYYLRLFEIGFYFHAFYWHLKHKIPENFTAEYILKNFYLDFLRVPKEDCLVLEMKENKLVTKCKNKCPILDLSLFLNIDTKISCKKISEGPCKYFLRKIDKKIIFNRNYNHIRPYKNDCEETILIK